MEKDDHFYNSVNSLVQLYSSNRGSQATRLIGFTVGLFTLIQIVQASAQGKLHNIFGEVSIINLEINPFGIGLINFGKIVFSLNF